MSSTDIDGQKLRVSTPERIPPTERESALAHLAISDLKTRRLDAPDEYRLYIDRYTGNITFRPIHYGKPEQGTCT